MKLVRQLRDLWAGRLPLQETLWSWGLFRGLLLNVGCTLVSMWIWLVYDTGPVAAVALGIHFLPVPYNVVFAVGAWRSAADPRHSDRARLYSRVVAIALAALYMFI
ncbi:MAG: hypothetical protein IPI48_02860 [bacterium]|jgi:hypothetical protein|nr:hypothetical protein [bacterium]MBK7769490.1 hypothetical protein [bacterium]MBK9777980.1 hypothetical protein [bacterium]